MVLKKVLNRVGYKLKGGNTNFKQIGRNALDKVSRSLSTGADFLADVQNNPIAQEVLSTTPYAGAANAFLGAGISGARQLSNITNRSNYSGNVNKVSGMVLEKTKRLKEDTQQFF
jgi:hypothetical protein